MISSPITLLSPLNHAIACKAKRYRAPFARPDMLDAFMRFLIDNGLLGREAPAEGDPWLDELIQVSCCIAIAGRLGLDHGYVFERFFYGPVSERLSDEFEEGAGPRARAGLGGDAPPLPASFDRERFLRLLAGRDADWIAAAARLILSSHARPDAEALAELVGGLSDDWSPEYCRGIVAAMTSPEIGIVMDYDRYSYDDPWQPEVASATHRPRAAVPAPAAAALRPPPL